MSNLGGRVRLLRNWQRYKVLSPKKYSSYVAFFILQEPTWNLVRCLQWTLFCDLVAIRCFCRCKVISIWRSWTRSEIASQHFPRKFCLSVCCHATVGNGTSDEEHKYLFSHSIFHAHHSWSVECTGITEVLNGIYENTYFKANKQTVQCT